MIVFEPELWAVSPLIPDGKTPTFKPAGTPASGDGAAAKSGGKSSDGLKLWDGGSFDFHDILDVINPLHHLPIVNSIYRSEVKDEIGAVPRILGSMLYGGGVVGALIGAATALVNIVVEHETGKDLGQHIYTAIFGEGAGTRRTTQLAAPKTGEAAGIAKVTEANPAGLEKAGAPAVAAAAKTATTGAAPGAKPLSSKADAALQAFVAGLAKNASPAAAAATNAAITRRGLRVSGSAAQAAAQAAAGIGAGKKAPPSKAEISTQFRRAEWYQRNQAILKAQAAALAKRQDSAANAGKPGGNDTKSSAAILHLFASPAAAAAVANKTTSGKAASPVASGAPTELAPAKSTSAKSTTAKQPAVAGPWVANEIASGLSKYEALVKARRATAGK